MIKSLLLPLLVLFFIGFTSITTGQTIYEVSFPNPNTHYIHVDVHFAGVPADSFDVVMPVWIPGSYMIREFSRHVEGFKSYDTGNNPVSFRKVRKNVWRIYNDTSLNLSVSYRVYAFELSVRTCMVDIDHAYINGPALFMYTKSLKDLPALINFKPRSEWNTITTALPQFGTFKWSRTAENYDQLADCPVVIGNQDVFSFDYKGIPHHIAMVGKGSYDKEKIKSDFYKIVDECTGIFGENPNKEYTFIVHNVGTGGGGLEHTNSTSVITNRNCYDSEKLYRNFLSLIAHEYFHVWIVKRVRPLELGPFDYENEVYTRQLWFFEGFTSFYDDYILFRAGIYSLQEYLDIVVGNVQTVFNTPGDSIQSLSESSFDAWIKFYRPHENSKNSTVSYYTKGGILAALMNIDILNTTGGKRSLDDVMNYLYHEHYKKLGRGLTDQELKTAFDTIAGKNYDDFYKKYIDGTEKLPVEEFFQIAGVELMRSDGMKKPVGYLGATFSQSGSRLMVSFVERGSAAWHQGLSVNDEILDVDGKEPMQVKDYLAEKEPGNQVTFRIIRAGLQREFTIVLGEPTNMELVHSFPKKITEEQKIIRSKWLK